MFYIGKWLNVCSNLNGFYVWYCVERITVKVQIIPRLGGSRFFYRKLNAITQYPKFRIPVIDKILANITSINFMLTLNLTSEYFLIAMKPKDTAKTSFVTRSACFDFKRISFRLSGTQFVFQNAMNMIFRPLLGKGVLIYLEDIIVITATFEGYLRLLREVFTLLFDCEIEKA